MEITAIKKGSTASRSELRVGDRVQRINGHRVTDFLDLYFHLSEEFIDLEVEREGRAITVALTRTYGEEFGLMFPQERFRLCGNKCPFCFVDQNPEGMRKPLYVRDDDYRFSFLDGHFITLTNLKESDFKRVIDYQMSPLYVSVHALDPEVRTYLLGTPRAKEIRPQLDRLTRAGITLHTQIVALPGVNDGRVMDQTVEGLFEYHPMIQSVGVVPVGLTAYMPAARKLRVYTREEAQAVCAHVHRLTEAYRARCGKGFVYLADEFLLLAGLPIPTSPYYDGFVQLGNGVGMVRELLNEFRRRKPALTRLKRRKIRRVVAVSAASVGPTMREVLKRKFPARDGVRVDTVIALNDTFGHSVTVTGLLGGKDIRNALKAAGDFDLALIPPNTLTKPILPGQTYATDGDVFIDDVTFDDLSAEFGGRLAVGFDSILEK